VSLDFRDPNFYYGIYGLFLVVFYLVFTFICLQKEKMSLFLSHLISDLPVKVDNISKPTYYEVNY